MSVNFVYWLGLGRLKDGLGRLKDGLGRLKDGLGRLKDGLGRLKDGLGRLKDGLGRLERRCTVVQAMHRCPGDALLSKGKSCCPWCNLEHVVGGNGRRNFVS